MHGKGRLKAEQYYRVQIKVLKQNNDLWLYRSFMLEINIEYLKWQNLPVPFSQLEGMTTTNIHIQNSEFNNL